MSKCKKVVSVFLVSVLVCAAAFFVLDFESNAAGVTVRSVHNEPTVSEYSGYINLYVNHPTAGYILYTVVWEIIPEEKVESAGTAETSMMNITVNSKNIVLKPYSNHHDSATINVWELTPGGDSLLVKSGVFPYGTTDITLSYGTIDAISLQGNYGTVSTYFGSYVPQVSVIWNDTGASNDGVQGAIESGNDLQEEGNKLQEESNELQKEQNETSKGILGKISDFFGSFFQNLIDSIVSVFVPEDGYFTDYFDRLYEFFSEKLGFLIYPFELMADFIGAYLSIGEGSGQIVISDVVMFDTTLIKATTFDLKGAMSDILGDYYDLYYAFVDCILIFGFVAYGMKKFNSVVGGTGE